MLSKSVQCFLLLMCSSLPVLAPTGFVDITDETGIDFIHRDGSSGNYYLAETVTAGLALFDYDNDGDLDIYFVNGAALPGAHYDPAPTNKLYRNDGNWKFTDVTEAAGVGDAGFGLGCAAADFDNDGNTDLYISNFAEDVLYRNNGDGTFSNVSERVGGGDPRVGAGVTFGDYNQDGWLDLYVANYIVCPLDDPINCSRNGIPMYCDPSSHDRYEAQQDSFYLNRGDGTFEDFSKQSGISEFRGRGMGIVSTDFDNDGDLDIYIANDVTANFLYANNGDATFEESALFAGLAYDLHGREQGSMACDFGDYDNDGDFDLILTVYQNQPNALYRNEGDGSFNDVSLQSGITAESLRNVSWACFFFDYDNDGNQDVFIANGHLQDRIEELEPSTRYHAPNQLFRNNGDGTFADSSAEAGPGFATAFSTRGGAYGDIDNDGDLDIVLSNSRSKPTILRNDFINSNHWISIQLTGTESNRNAIGARVTVESGGAKQMNEVRAGGSYQSQYDTRLHFGLGKSNTIEKLTIRWPNGKVEEFSDVKADRFISIQEDAQHINTIR